MGKKIFPTLLFSPILYCGLLSLNFINPAYGAEEDISNASIISYEKDYFVIYAPVTLLDMLQRIPGVQEILDKNAAQSQGGGNGANARAERGFGSGGDQILINGKRLAGKTNNINDNLARISATNISKVELIRGATSGLDVQSQGLVINVIMEEDASTSTTFWKLSGQYLQGHDNFSPGLLVSHSGSSGNLDYMFNGEREYSKGFFDRDELHFNVADVQTGEKEIHNMISNKATILNSNLSYAFESGSELRINGMYEKSSRDRNEIQIETGSQPLHTIWDTAQNFDKWEIGGDYTQTLGSLGQLKTLLVINSNKDEKAVIRVEDLGNSSFQFADEQTTVDRSEKILRSSLTKNITNKQSLEIGGEAAFNTFDKSFNDSRRTAPLEPLLLSTADNVEIEEKRYEIFANHSYNISSKLIIQSSLTAEFSKIVADNIFADGSISRRDTNFTYLKPRFNVRYDYTDRDQIRFIVEKKVSQLNFNNFVTSFNQRTGLFEIGNTEIRPEQIWEFSLTYEHRFANDNGSIEAEVFYRSYKDYINKVDFSEFVDFAGNPIGVEEFFALPPTLALRDNVNFSTKSGNIDKASAKGFKIKSNFRLAMISMPNATLSLAYVYDKRRAIDQFTLELLNFPQVSDHTFTFNYRHDVTDMNFSYGFNGIIRSKILGRDKNFTWPWQLGTNIKLFAEKTIYQGIKIRVEASQESMGMGHSTLTFFKDHRRFNDQGERSEKNHQRARVLLVSLQGSF